MEEVEQMDEHEMPMNPSSPKEKAKGKAKNKRKPLGEESEDFDGDDEFEVGGSEKPEEFYHYTESPKDRLTQNNQKKRSWKKTLSKHKRTVITAVLLFLAGIVFLFMGIYGLLDHQGSRTVAYFVISALTIIPGAYQTFYIFKALRGEDGYRFSEIPHADV